MQGPPCQLSVMCRLKGQSCSCHRQTGPLDKSERKLLVEATAVMGKASTAFYSLMRGCDAFQVTLKLFTFTCQHHYAAEGQ